MYIESVKNNRVKQWKKLLTKKEREKTKTYMIEGFHMVEEAVKNNAHIHEIMLEDESMLEEIGLSSHQMPENVWTISPEVARVISGAETPQGIFAIIVMPEEITIEAATGPYLLLDRVQAPGNVGTMIRTADAAGFEGVLLGDGCADIYNDKTLRSTQGSHFHLKIYRKNLMEVVTLFKKWTIPVYGTALDEEAKSYDTVEKSKVFALIMGNEGQGLAQELLAQTTANLYIPIQGKAESLNVAVAAGIVMFELQKN